MMKQIKIADLCSELEQKLVELHYSDGLACRVEALNNMLLIGFIM